MANALNESTKFLYFFIFYSFLASKVKENVKLLITTRLEMENESTFVWGQLLNKIKEIDTKFGHSKKQITRKYLNLKITYKRIKQIIPVGKFFFSFLYIQLLTEIFCLFKIY